MPENRLSAGMERLLRALDRTREPGLSGTLEALGEALGLSFAALIGRPRQNVRDPMG